MENFGNFDPLIDGCKMSILGALVAVVVEVAVVVAAAVVVGDLRLHKPMCM